MTSFQNNLKSFDDLIKEYEERNALYTARIDAWMGVHRAYKVDGSDFQNMKKNFCGCTMEFTRIMADGKIWGTVEVNHTPVGEYHEDKLYFDGIDSPEALERKIDERIILFANRQKQLTEYVKLLYTLKPGIENAIDTLRNEIKVAEQFEAHWPLRDYILNNVDCKLGNRNR